NSRYGSMVWASVQRYRWLSGAAIFLLSIDLAVNATFLLFSHNTLLTLLIYIVQDVFLVFSLIILFLALFSTSLTQAGLIKELLNKFKWSIIFATAYLGLSLGFHSLSLKQQWLKPDYYIWNHEMVALFTIQRVVAAIHYYFYKNAILQLSDSSFYMEIPRGYR
ncbi:unnamed protein product, partial [Meganyctiphanes norvegica]